jgi:DnaJ-class molecular chaperone
MARKTTSKAAPKAPSEPIACTACKGSGTVARTVRVGRRHRTVGQQDGLCLACLGTGTAS